MERIPYETILDIQKRVNIVDVISEYLPLEKRGKNYFAICPFHDDHNPSMSISSEKQIYTCFVCGASGNAFHFLMNYEKISFGQAVSKLASKVGINLSYNFDDNNKVVDKTNEKYYKMFDLANKYYQNNIKTSYAKKAREYLINRNLDDEIIKTFEIGLSFDDNGLSKLLSSKNYLNEDMQNVGISGIKDDFVFDIFRNRIMFPIHDENGMVIGFSGRIYNDSKDNKYVNSKESVIFKKGNILYNYHRAINYCRNEKMVIVVEGFMDVIRLYTVGIKNVVATMGTAVTKEHANLIRRLSKNVVLCFDGDSAGKKATKSAIDVLENIGIEPKIIRLEENLDPDDYIVKKGKEHFLNHLKNAMTSLEFKLALSKEEINFNDPKEISNYVNVAVKELEKISDKVVYELTLKKISAETGVDEKTIESLVNVTPKKESIKLIKPVSAKKNKYVIAEEHLIYYMLNDVDAILIYRNNPVYLSNRILSRIAYEIDDFYDKKGYVNITDFITYLEDKTELINEALRIDALELPKKSSNEQIKDYINTIDEGIIKHEIEKLKLSISKETNVAKKVVLLEKMATLKKKESV